ncbi:MAG: LicD family protein [Bacilli bacterium]|nr:LicD family protein [Bacilli bacterium]MBO6195537.1 LicD family protein [Bacilli bacterium]
MKKISIKEQQLLLIEMLDYITKICDKNNINYSLIGGSLIGAIRHKGMIPWDDDIDIILMPNEYEKLIDILKKKNDKYYLLESNNQDYSYPFSKLIDRRTFLIEEGQEVIENYGVYLDIFKYKYVSNNKIIRYIQYKTIVLVKMLIGSSAQNRDKIKKEKNIIKRLRNFIAHIIGNNNLIKIYENMYRNNIKKTNYILSNWPAYGFKKEIQLTDNMKLYKKVKFENIESMISSNYDEILKTTFGDYMKLPPKEKRKSHHKMKVYWRDKDEKIEK